MAKITLSFEENFDFFLIALSSHVKDYRICWSINQCLSIGLKKAENLELKLKNEIIGFSLYDFYLEEEMKEYFLIGNRCPKGFLIPEKKQVDYFLIVKGPIKKAEKSHILSCLKQQSIILQAFELNTNELKSKKNLIF